MTLTRLERCMGFDGFSVVISSAAPPTWAAAKWRASMAPSPCFSASARADHALVVAALIAAGGVEISDADIGGALDHAGVGGDHATEAHAGDFQAGLAERAVAQLRGGERGAQRCVMLLVVSRRAGGGCRGGHGQSGDQEIAAR